jgi:16S rRNA (uracil1498-N3)-methyltransferase
LNLLLLEAGEVTPTGECVVSGRRADHLRTVLQVEVGSTVRAGVLDGPTGTATVRRIHDRSFHLVVDLRQQPAPLRDALLLATPRPKVLMRMLAHAASMGFADIVLFRSWRVDKTWMQSRTFEPAVQKQQLMLGLEQAGRTQLPRIHRFDLFKPMVEDHLPQLSLPPSRFVAHPTAATSTHQLEVASAPFCLAIGPDGGFLPYEVDKLGDFGCLPITCGPHPLRTETALATLWGQLDLLRTRR